MATAKKTSKTIIQETVDLQLSNIEAQTLVTILAMVGGNPDTTHRKHSDSIYEALQGAGIRSLGSQYMTGCSYFNELPKGRF